MFKDNQDFYPTPGDLFYQLIDGLRTFQGRVLEPSAGKGDMIKHIQKMNRYRRDDLTIDAIENDENLIPYLHEEKINLVWNDFLTYKTYKEYDYIVMNPPFSNGVDHVLKAIELAESQINECEIYAILNKETLDNAYSNKRKDLETKLEKYNAKVRYVNNGFSDSERKTEVEVALVKLMVINNDAGKTIYEKIPFFKNMNETKEELGTTLSTYVKDSEISSRLNDIERLVLEYETACEVAKSSYLAQKEKESFFNYIRKVNDSENSHRNKLQSLSYSDLKVSDVTLEIDRLRSGYWELILDTDEFKEKLTNEARNKLNRQMEVANEMEINLHNIRMLLMAINSNQEDMLIDSIVSMFKKITQYHMNQYSSNIHYYDGWKTNNAYKINKKIIIPIRYEESFNYKSTYETLGYQVKQYVDDIVKSFQLIDSEVNNDFENVGEREFKNDLLRFKLFKNGNIHIWFNDLKLLNKLNYLCGQHFNWIPSEEEIKNNKVAKEYVVKEFGNMYKEKLLV